MNSLLSVNNDMNVFSMNVHSGERPLYNNLLALGGKFPWIVGSIRDYPLFTMAVERGEEDMYVKFVSELENLNINKNEVRKSVRLGG